MRIGILSDTHSYLPTKIKELFAGVDHILHAGDIGSASVLRELGQIAPVKAIRGNIDGDAFYFLEQSERFCLEGLRFMLIHNAGDPLRPRRDIVDELRKKPVDILISGHYHAFWVHELKDIGVLWLSPGACGNSGHHLERFAMRLEFAPENERGANLLKELKLEKLHLGARGTV
ncbi:MAG: metallophosphoesterase family protein [Bradymonadales bacterium]|jgi:putative phosphoesterase